MTVPPFANPGALIEWQRERADNCAHANVGPGFSRCSECRQWRDNVCCADCNTSHLVNEPCCEGFYADCG